MTFYPNQLRLLDFVVVVVSAAIRHLVAASGAALCLLLGMRSLVAQAVLGDQDEVGPAHADIRDGQLAAQVEHAGDGAAAGSRSAAILGPDENLAKLGQDKNLDENIFNVFYIFNRLRNCSSLQSSSAM